MNDIVLRCINDSLTEYQGKHTSEYVMCSFEKTIYRNIYECFNKLGIIYLVYSVNISILDDSQRVFVEVKPLDEHTKYMFYTSEIEIIRTVKLKSLMYE